MNKAEFAEKIAEKSGLPLKDVKVFLKAYTDTIADTLKAGDKVQLMGFGTYEVRERKERIAHNPLTGEEVKVDAKKVPVFTAGKGLKEQI